MLLSKEKSVFADIPNPLTRLKDKDLHRPPAVGSLHASDTFFFCLFGLGLAGAESCGDFHQRERIYQLSDQSVALSSQEIACTQHASGRSSRYCDLQQIKRFVECIQVSRGGGKKWVAVGGVVMHGRTE